MRLKNEKEKPTMNPACIAALAKGDIANALVAATPGGIEAQEASEQARAVRNSLIPNTVGFPGNKKVDSRPLLEALGFSIKGTDELFHAVVLPPGWEIVPTGHSMWSNINFNGVTVMTMFYKGAFYDRRADLNIHEKFAIRFEVTQDERLALELTPERLTEFADAMINHRGKVHTFHYKRDWTKNITEYESLDWPEIKATESMTERDWDFEEKFRKRVGEQALAAEKLEPKSLPSPDDYMPSVVVVEWADGTRTVKY
jgi:hypothetical protein